MKYLINYNYNYLFKKLLETDYKFRESYIRKLLNDNEYALIVLNKQVYIDLKLYYFENIKLTSSNKPLELKYIEEVIFYNKRCNMKGSR
jgi:hypothetical protein